MPDDYRGYSVESLLEAYAEMCGSPQYRGVIDVKVAPANLDRAEAAIMYVTGRCPLMFVPEDNGLCQIKLGPEPPLDPASTARRLLRDLIARLEVVEHNWPTEDADLRIALDDAYGIERLFQERKIIGVAKKA